ncbi:F-box domain containing protein [Tanacetum coccineum]
MSNNIPLEIQMEIMQRFPVNSLLQFRTVSKTWKSFIDGRNFLVSYGVRPTQPSRFLVSYELVVPYDPSKACVEKIAFGFGVHPKTLGPTIIKISYPDSREGLWTVYLFTLSYGYWKTLPPTHLPRVSIRLKRSSQVAIGCFIY